MGKDREGSPPSFFSKEEQKLFIQTFFDDKIQRMLDRTCRDKQVYVRIAEKLGEAGYERTASECKNKINNLKTWYKRHHNRPGKPGKSGGACQKRSEIYQLLDEFMSEKPSVKSKHFLRVRQCKATRWRFVILLLYIFHRSSAGRCPRLPFFSLCLLTTCYRRQLRILIQEWWRIHGNPEDTLQKS